MTRQPDWQQLSKQISSELQQSFPISDVQPVSGGCINTAYLFRSDDKEYFIKLNQPHLTQMFQAELAGLNEIASTQTVKVPQAMLAGSGSDFSFLVMERINLAAGNNAATQAQLGHQLAALHQIKHDFFGWHQDNTIGSTPQHNDFSTGWVAFWQNQRLGFQLALAEQNGYSGKWIDNANKLSELLACFYSDYQPHPALLHGDLWSGNAAATAEGDPVIFDPACYYGDREADIAMTELFGGFNSHFYAAYNESYALDSGYNSRKKLYNLYHILNHLNLFGSGYLHQAQNMISGLIAEVS